MRTSHLPVVTLSVLTLLAVACCSLITPAEAKPYLVEWAAGGHNDPTYIVRHVDFIETRPFDGMMIADVVSGNLMISQAATEAGQVGGSWTYEEILKRFSPLTAKTFRKFKHNFAVVWMGMSTNPPDMFDDAAWAKALVSCRNFGRAIKTLGIRGVFFDDEIYTYKYWSYPDDVADKGKSLSEYVAKARQRGREVMQAFAADYPSIVVIALHGPYMGCKSAQPYVKIWCSDSYLLGAFAAGLVEGSGPRSLAVDGGELYDVRTLAEFKTARQYRKFTLASPTVPCPFMDNTLRAVWSRKCSISWGLFDNKRFITTRNGETTYSDWALNRSMRSVRNTMANALRTADDYVWHYSETIDWWKAPGVTGGATPAPQEWLDAFAGARLDAERAGPAY